MPANLFNFSRYFKKSTPVNQDDPSTDQSVSDQGDQSPQTVVVSSTSSAPSLSTPTAYSGIGNPPAGVAYNGIGTPPSPKVVPPIPVSSSIDMGKRVGMDVLSRLTQRANASLMQSVAKVKELHQELIDTEHVLWGLLHDTNIYQLISECKATPADLQKEIEQNFKTGNFSGQPHFSPRVKRVLEMSLSAARSLGFEFISPEHILISLSSEGEGLAARILSKYHLTTQVLNQKVTGKKELEKEQGEKKGSSLDQYTEDLTAKAAKGGLDPVVGRSWEIERVIHILSRRTKNNPVLIGDAGVGKTAIVEGLAEKIARGDVPETLLHKRILLLDLMSLIAGAGHRGEFEERLKNLIKEVKAAAGGIILFIDEIHNMVGAGSGSEGTMDASNILKPSLARGELQVIGTTTVTEYRKNIEKDPALERRFQPILVPEPTAEVAIEMVTALRDKYEAFHRVKISDEAIEAAVILSQRYIADRFLPDKAVDLIDEAAAAVRLPAISLPEEIKSGEDKLKRLNSEKQEAEKAGDSVRTDTISKEIEELNKTLTGLKEQYQLKKSTTTNAVTPDIIAEIVSRWTNIPVAKLTEKESGKLINLENIIHERLINQDEAVAAVAEAVRRGRAGLKSGKRPIGSFIFLGPTGVGKTELAKTLAEVLFGSEEMMVRLDMSEYMEKHEVAKLIGAPPGYVGYDEGGQLTEAVRRRPYCVVLLDEIEKANPDVFNILIQLLDDGRLTDNKGRTVSFKNTIVICTSNLGSGIIQEELLKQNQISVPKADQPLAENIPASPAGIAVRKDQKATDTDLNVSTSEAKNSVGAKGVIQNLPSITNIKTDSKSTVNQYLESNGDKFTRIAERLMEEIRKFFRPELLNRFDEVVIFRPLTRDHMSKIIELQAKGLEKLLIEQNIRLTMTPVAKSYLAETGFDPVFGARPLRRTIQRLVENQISSLLIKGEAVSGDTVTVDFAGGELSFKVTNGLPVGTRLGIELKEQKLNGNIKAAESTVPVTAESKPVGDEKLKNLPPSDAQNQQVGLPAGKASVVSPLESTLESYFATTTNPPPAESTPTKNISTNTSSA